MLSPRLVERSVHRDAARLIGALSHVERLPLLVFLGEPRAERDVRRQFPAVPVGEVRRSLGFLADADWVVRTEDRGPEGREWVLQPRAARVVAAWLHELVPSARPSRDLSLDRLRLEVVAVRRRSARGVLRAIQSDLRCHADLVAATHLQSGVVSDAVRRLELAGLAVGGAAADAPALHILRFLASLVSDEIDQDRVRDQPREHVRTPPSGGVDWIRDA
jgi:hypothetical protein